MSEPVDYQAVLADLKQRRTSLDHAIAVLEALVGGGETGTLAPPISVPTGAPSVPRSIKPDTFYSLNILEATKKYLAMAREAQSTELIADALRTGGLTAKTESVAAILQRAINAGDTELRRPRRGMWGLAGWYGR
jgi:hypothetical protein